MPNEKPDQLTSDSLRELAQSTLNFFQRFDVQPQIAESVQNFQEETRELIEAAQDGTDKNHIAEEAADVFVTAIGLCYAAGINVDQLIQQVHYVIAKNDAKTHQTHIYADGKIRRRSAK